MADKRGVANLTPDHWRRVACGLASLEDVARELGVRRQTIHKAFGTRGWTKEAWAQRQQAEEAERQRQQQASASRSSPDDAEENQGLLPEAQRDQLLRQVGLGIVKAGTTLVAELNAGIDRERGKMTPTVINSYLRAMERLNGALIPWLMPPPPEAAAEQSSQLIVSVMSDDEVAELKARKVVMGEDDDAEDAPVSAAAPVPVATPCPSLSTAQSPKPLVTIHDSLPDRNQFGPWLHQLAERRGRRHLRDCAQALGLSVAAGQDTQLIIDLIMHATDGDPERLRSVAKVVE
ncbi:hypothetical protein [Azospirillum thermophilum]|uniref:hypothetical protein n=1 Tax=Azospirillum thermophilum TaxID=2202148 RepID=UPI0011B5969D|nr:hypothetical protein [Azospirillum thermophilum]